LVAWSLRLLVVLALLAAAPAALGQVLQTRAARLQALGLGGEAERASQWATMVTPWSLGAALQYQHLRLDHGAPPLDVAEALGDLGDRFAQNPKPLLLAAALIEKHLDKLLAKDVDENVTRVSTAGAFELIVRLYALAAEREPHNAIVWWQLGRALDRAGRADESRRAYERAVNEEPHCARALVQLALLAQRAGYPEHARALLAVIDEAIASAASENGRARDILSLDAESAKILAMIEVPSP
jgi:tetratricopeptide (TPR) repeat protein